MAVIEQLLLKASPAISSAALSAVRRQWKVIVVHGLGGIGKT
jgi:hypothetical protein